MAGNPSVRLARPGFVRSRRLPVAVLLALFLAACGGSRGAEGHPAASQPPAPATSSLPPAAPGVPATPPDQAVCMEFFAQGPGHAGAAAFMAWMTTGPGQVAAGEADSQLTGDITTWYRDVWGGGNPADGALDLDVVDADCGDAGVSQQG